MASGGQQTEVSVEAAGLTDVGHERENNEDAFLIATLQRTMEVHEASPGAHARYAERARTTSVAGADRAAVANRRARAVVVGFGGG